MQRSVTKPADTSRRHFLKLAAASALIPLLDLSSRSAEADDLKPLNYSNPTAIGLAYKKTQQEAATVEGYQEGRQCDNCALYTDKNQGCQLFPGYSVEPAGWCKAWVAKPAG